MFNTKVTILPIFLALVLIYLIIGDCLILKLLLSVGAAFLLYINFLPAVQASCRNNDCIVAPIDGKITDINYTDNKAVITISTRLYNKSILTMPKNDYTDVSVTNGVLLNAQKKLAKKLNQTIVYKMHDCNLKITPQYFKADNYIKPDRYYIGDIIGRIFCGKIELELFDYDVKVALGDEIKNKTTVLAYKNEQ